MIGRRGVLIIGGIVLVLLPQDVDHLAEDADSAIAAAPAGALDHLTHPAHEPDLVRLAIDHEGRECIARVEHDERLGTLKLYDVERPAVQLAQQGAAQIVQIKKMVSDGITAQLLV